MTLQQLEQKYTTVEVYAKHKDPIKLFLLQWINGALDYEDSFEGLQIKKVYCDDLKCTWYKGLEKLQKDGQDIALLDRKNFKLMYTQKSEERFLGFVSKVKSLSSKFLTRVFLQPKSAYAVRKYLG